MIGKFVYIHRSRYTKMRFGTLIAYLPLSMGYPHGLALVLLSDGRTLRRVRGDMVRFV